MLAFPLLELGHLTEPEKAARKGNEINKTTLGLINAWVSNVYYPYLFVVTWYASFSFVCFGVLCHVLQTECRFNNAVKFMKGWSASWDCCFSLRCKFIFRQIRITSSDHLKKLIKNTQTFATFQLGIHITGGMSLSVTW